MNAPFHQKSLTLPSRFYSSPKISNELRIWQYIKVFFLLLKETIIQYNKDKVVQMGAALSYYTIFSLPAILIISIALVGFFFGEEAVKGGIYRQISELIGEGAALQIQEVIIGISDSDQNWWATILGIGVLIFGATGVFYALQSALNKIFGVTSLIKIGILRVITNRILSFGMVIAVSFIILTSLFLNTIFIALTKYVSSSNLLQEYAPEWAEIFQNSGLHLWKSSLSFIALTVFFAMIYKVLPDVRLKWKHILLGALLTSILFALGEMLLRFYINNTNFWTAYGAAGSVVVLLIWVFYSSQMIFIGAEFIKVFCQYRGVEIKPKEYAVMNVWSRKKKEEARSTTITSNEKE